jgi:hypothetical protein
VIRELGSEQILLSSKVIHLFGGRDTSVTTFLFLNRYNRYRETKNVFNILEVIVSVPGWSFEHADFTRITPYTKSTRGNV